MSRSLGVTVFAALEELDRARVALLTVATTLTTVREKASHRAANSASDTHVED